MNIRNKGKVIKKIDRIEALYLDCRKVEKVSRIASFILSYNLAESVSKGRRDEIKKLYRGLMSGYKIPRKYRLNWSNKRYVVSEEKGITDINLKEFNRIVYKEYKSK